MFYVKIADAWIRTRVRSANCATNILTLLNTTKLTTAQRLQLDRRKSPWRRYRCHERRRDT